MNKWKAFFKSFYKNVIVKRKIKPFLLILFDKNFRSDLNRLHEYTKNCTRTEIKRLDYECIQPGHRIIYVDYAEYLRANEKQLSIPPIRVVAVPNGNGRHIIVDGNHRLPAMIKRAKRTDYQIKCEVMI